MLSELAFFTFLSFDDDVSRRRYNAWGAWDHTPENRRLEGVAWGDRWERTADCGEQEGPGPLSATDFLTMYWFSQPHDASIAAWAKLSRDSFQWGRGSAFPGIKRALAGLFVPIRGYVAPSIHMDADALPFRPHRGIHVTVLQYDEPHAREAHEQFRWHDRVAIPDLVGRKGVAGAWSFTLDREYHPKAESGKIASVANLGFAPGSIRIILLFLDEDPVLASEEITRVQESWASGQGGAPNAGIERVLYQGPLRTIDPWLARADDPDFADN